MKTRTIGSVMVGLVLVAAACGGDDGAATDGPQPGMETMAEMNMGDVSLTRADEVDGASLAEGGFELLATAPFGFDRLAGTAWLARHDSGTTVTLELSGLQPDSAYVAHVHAGTCAEAGGPHFQFDPDGGTTPPNEIHLAFDGDPAGDGFMTVAHDSRVGSEARSVVVHSTVGSAPKVACADLG